MSITATWFEGVSKPTGEVEGVIPGKMYRVFSDEELFELTESTHWLKAAEQNFKLWDNDEDAVYDKL